MNPRYLFTILGRSTNLLCPFDVTTLPLGYKSELIPLDFGGYKVLVDDGSTPTVLARLYNASKTFIQDVAITIGEWYPFTTLYSGARYVELSFSNATTPEHVFFGQEETFDSWFNNVFNPLWKDDLTMEFAKESQQEFFRRKLSGKLTFIKDDYTYIKSKSLDYQFQMRMMISYDNGENWADYWKGHFYWTDCDFDEDSKYIRVTPTVDDEYNDILAGLEKEYNMIDLAPAYDEIQIKKRPVIQIIPATMGGISSKAGCFHTDGTYWERDVNPVTSQQPLIYVMSHDYYFNLASGILDMTITPRGAVPDGFPTHIREMFVGHVYNTSQGYNEYALRHSFTLQSGQWRIEYQFEAVNIIITNVTTGVVTWQGTLTVTGPQLIPPSDTQYGSLIIDLDVINLFFSRLVFGKQGVTGAKSIPASDIMANNENYHYCLQEFDVTNNIYYTETYSTTPTKWGKYDSSQYYIEPSRSNVRGWSPIAQTTWDTIAYWFGYTASLLPVEPETMVDATLKNAYKIRDVISVLLKKVAPNITVARDSFLNGTDPITGDTRTFFLTPKSNVKKLDYDTPAMNAPITLKYIFDMLRDCFRCYWYIEDNVLKIEHIRYFLNGHTYNTLSPTQRIGIDLTQQFVTRNGKTWAYSTSKYTFDKPELTERYEFSWMDNETEPFNGEPINIIGGFVEQGKVEKINIQMFSSDVDYIMSNPEDISDDGFVLLGAVSSAHDWVLAFKEFEDMNFVKLQNAYCAFAYMEVYYLDDLPSNKYQIGDGSIQQNAKMKKYKTQEVSFPCIYDPDMQKLVKTSIGNGQFEKLSINLSSRNGKATLKYNPYE